MSNFEVISFKMSEESANSFSCLTPLQIYFFVFQKTLRSLHLNVLKYDEGDEELGQ